MSNNWQQDWISKWALYSPNSIAIEEDGNGKTITYAQLNEKANGIAHYLLQFENITVGSRIAVIDDFSIHYIALFSAFQKAGLILIPLNYRLALPEITDILEDADPSIIFYNEKYSHLIADNHRNKYQLINTLDNISPEKEFTVNPVDADHPIFILYTSGTTGKPKGVLYSHKMLFWNSINTAITLKINSDSKTVVVMPPFHTGGWNVLLTPFLHHGGTVYLCKKFEAGVVLHLIEKMSCNIFMGVPTMLAMMANEPTFNQCNISSLDYIIVGGESMPIPLIERYAEKGVAIRQGYGMTEVGPNLTSLHQEDAIRKKGSIGRPNFYVDIKIVTESGVDAKPNEPGELWLKGPMVTKGYWKNNTASLETFSTDGQWFKTGDMVIEDTEKYLYIVDRLKNMFISGGENVYPAEIEKILIQHPKVKECCVIGVKDEKWGEVGKAFISKTDATLTENEVQTFCQLNLAKFKVPKYIHFLEELPKSDSGKIDRKKLKSL